MEYMIKDSQRFLFSNYKYANTYSVTLKTTNWLMTNKDTLRIILILPGVIISILKTLFCQDAYNLYRCFLTFSLLLDHKFYIHKIYCKIQVRVKVKNADCCLPHPAWKWNNLLIYSLYIINVELYIQCSCKKHK